MHQLIFPDIKGTWGHVNLATEALSTEEPNPLLDPDVSRLWKADIHRKHQIDFSYGGYLEDRSRLWRGSYLQPGCAWHLGIDYTVPEGTPVRLPFDATLRTLSLCPEKWGWGGKAVFQLPSGLFAIFGHLDLGVSSLGSRFSAGDLIGTVAPSERNGGWAPHLHVQFVSRRLDPDAVDGYSALYPGIERDFPLPKRLA